MFGLTINSIEIIAITNGGRFSAKIPFYKGLNIIRAENSSGKSTCINALAYGLGLEAILGPSRKRPFPKSLYEVIYDDKKEEKPYFVRSSHVSIVIENSNGDIALLKRDIQGDENKVIIESDIAGGNYFLGTGGKGVGSVISEKGFHYWLSSFIGWDLPDVITFEGKITKLYLECIFPLFFIEQKRGWSEIQANTPTHYGIKNVKKLAAEFCLAIESFEHEKKVAILQKTIDDASNEWENLRSSILGIADFNSVRVENLQDLNSKILKYSIDFRYPENEVFISIDEQEIALNRLTKSLSEEISEVTPGNIKLTSQLAVIRGLQREIEEKYNSVETTLLSISEVEIKLITLNHDFDQYRQLRRLKTVGSDIEKDLITEKCPICESDLFDTLGSNTSKRKPMTLEENIDFLKNQLDFFGSIKKRNISQLQKFQYESRLLNSRMTDENEKLSSLREDVNDINGATKLILREKIRIDILLANVLRLKETRKELNDQANRIFIAWSKATESLILLRRNKKNSGKDDTIRKLESYIKENLLAFNFKPSAINSISVSRHSLRPEQEGYDIVAETSASDYIRIIWAYTLALMQFAGTNENIKHGGFVVFDEPRQHEASKISFANLIDTASKSKKYGGQVIFATSLEEKELKESCSDLDVNLSCFDNYILTLERL